MAKRIVVIGTLDHGKTTLIKALGAFYENPAVERNGSTEASILVNGEEYVFFDYPDTEDYLANLKHFDGVVLCVAVTDGPMGTVYQQMALCEELGMSQVVVFINKTDLRDDEEIIDLCKFETEEFLYEHGVDGCESPVIQGSAERACTTPTAKWVYPIIQLAETVAATF